MVSIVLGVGALGAALVGGGGGYFFWKKTEPNSYDASMYVSYKRVYSRDIASTELSDAIHWKLCAEGFLEDNQATNLVVIGNYKHGRTFVLNGIAGTQLETGYASPMEGIKFKKTSWIASDKRDLEVLLIDTEGYNRLPGDATNRDLMAKRQRYDQFMQEVAVRLADVPVLVTDVPSISMLQKVNDICTTMGNSKNTRTLVIVYNMCNIENKDDLSQFFEREVVVRFNCSKYENSMPLVSYHYHNETIGDQDFKIVHLPLAKEGSEASKQFHKNTYNCLRYLVEVETMRKEDAGERKLAVKEQLGSMTNLFNRALNIALPKGEFSIPTVTLGR